MYCKKCDKLKEKIKCLKIKVNNLSKIQSSYKKLSKENMAFYNDITTLIIKYSR